MYQAAQTRYKDMKYNRVGTSGLKLPAVSLGFWHNFGSTAPYENMKNLCFTAFDNGITHFDLANNYGPESGAAEKNLGRILKEEMSAYRDELIITTKAGYGMWDGPYGDGGSRKYLLASLDQSLERMGLDYVDIFYHHRMDTETPLEETMGALAQAVKSGKEVEKYFPAEQAGGLPMIKAMAAPYHQLRFMQTGGINPENLKDYLAFDKILCCGGSWMVKGNLLKEGKFDEVCKLTKEAKAIADAVRK